jgi:hypothetical protein
MINSGTAGISGLSGSSSGSNSFLQTNCGGGRIEEISSGTASSGGLSTARIASSSGGTSAVCVSCSGGVSSAIGIGIGNSITGGIGDSIIGGIGDKGEGLCREGSFTAGGDDVVSFTRGVPAQETAAKARQKQAAQCKFLVIIVFIGLFLNISQVFCK